MVMDNRFGDIETFLAVASGGSFAAAAKALRLTPSAVSRSIARLEQRLGTILFRRTTRSLALTAEGSAYRDRMSVLLAEIETVESDLGREKQGPRGLLRVNASPSIGVPLLPILPRFTARYPEIILDLALSDTIVDLVEERADIAIRIGPLRDTSLRAKKLGHSRMVLVASPAYLDQHGRPEQPEDLAKFDTISIAEIEWQSWELSGPEGRTFKLEHQPRLMCGDFLLTVAAAKKGLGIALLPESVCCQALRDGDLEVILPHWSPPDGIVHCVYPSRRGVLPAVRVLIDWLAERMPEAVKSVVGI